MHYPVVNMGRGAARIQSNTPFLAGKRLGAVQAVTDATISQAMSAPKAIIDFWSPGCPYCVQFKPIFEEVAATSPIPMFTAEIEKSPNAFAPYNAHMLPTVIFLANGKEVHRAEGGMSKEDFLGEMAQAFGGAAPAPAGSQPQVSVQKQLPMTTVVSSGSSGTWVALGGLAAAGVMGWLLLRQ